MNRRRFVTLGSAALAGAWLAGCGGREAHVVQATRDGILIRGNGAEPEALDPHIVRGVSEWTIIGALFEGLVRPDPATLRPIPAAAESWAVSPDGLTYTFRLRAGLRWSDGSALTAEDFVWSARRLTDPSMGSAHVEDTLIFVRGVRDLIAGRGGWDQVAIRALDERTIEFGLDHPVPFFPSALAAFYPVPRATVEKFGGWTDRSSAWTRAGNMVCNGPFLLTRWEQNQDIQCRRNPQYWDVAAVRLNGVTFLPYDNPAAEELAFRSGQLHLTYGVPLQKIETYQRDEPEVLKIVPDLGNYFYSLNTTRPPFNDARIRRAFSLATDRESLVRNVVRGGKVAANAFTPPDLAGYTARPRLRYDPAAARALLAEAGFPDGRGFPRVELLIDSRDSHRAIAEAMQAMWNAAIGVRVELRNEEPRVLVSSKRSMQFDLSRGSWNASYLDPWFFLSPWVTGGLYNESQWSDPRYDALIAAATKEANPTARLDLLRNAEDVLLEELPIIPLYWSTQVFLLSPHVKGYTAQPFADRAIKSLWLE